MLNLQTILCPTDLSDTSVQSIPLAAWFARLHGADLHLLNVHLLHAMSPPQEDVPFPGEQEAREALEASAAGIEWNQVVHRVERGINAAPTILEYAEANDVDLIVMGSHGRRGFRRLLLGSVTSEVVRMSPIPVLVVRHEPDAEPPRSVDRVVVPVDFSAATDRAVRIAVELATTFDAPIELLHAVEPIPYMQMAYPISVDTSEFEAQAQSRLDEMSASLEFSGDVRARAVVGLTEDVVAEAAGRSDAPLVVMSSHGQSGVARVLLGSTTERLLRQAPCPVLVVRGESENAAAAEDR